MSETYQPSHSTCCSVPSVCLTLSWTPATAGIQCDALPWVLRGRPRSITCTPTPSSGTLSCSPRHTVHAAGSKAFTGETAYVSNRSLRDHAEGAHWWRTLPGGTRMSTRRSIDSVPSPQPSLTRRYEHARPEGEKEEEHTQPTYTRL